MWEKIQVRPYPDSNGTWKGNVFGVQCCYGFASLDDEQGGHRAVFGEWLPDDAVRAVRESGWAWEVQKECAGEQSN